MEKKKGFTLIELLVVIAILAVLATAVVLILNPAQLVRQGRDSTRISDLAAVNSAIALFLSDVTSVSGYWYATTTCTFALTSPPTGFVGHDTTSSTIVTGLGWVSVNFGQISSGAPLSRLPVDPVNDATYAYCYQSTSNSVLTYEINANMESTKYGQGGGGDVEDNSKDGGNDANWYEIGNDSGLDLASST